jgi:hypothetical protein
MTDRIRGFDKPLGHARTQSDKAGQETQPTPRATPARAVLRTQARTEDFQQGTIYEVKYRDDGGVDYQEVPVEIWNEEMFEEGIGQKLAENPEPENLSFAEKRAVFEQQASSAPETSANHAPEPEKLRKGSEIPRLKMPTAGEPESHVGLPEVDVIPEITTARPNVGTPRRQMAGHARNASDQLGLKEKKTTEKPKRLFDHRRIVTDRGETAPKIGDRTPRTPREAPSRNAAPPVPKKTKPLPVAPPRTPSKPLPEPPGNVSREKPQDPKD